MRFFASLKITVKLRKTNFVNYLLFERLTCFLVICYNELMKIAFTSFCNCRESGAPLGSRTNADMSSDWAVLSHEWDKTTLFYIFGGVL